MAYTSWTRRTFIHTAGALTSLAALENMAPSVSAMSLPSQSVARFAFTTSADHHLHVFTRIPSGSWTRIQTLASEAPAALALSPNRRFLYVANAVDLCDNLPTGSIEAYVIHPQAGTLTLLNRKPLALWATRPSHLAVSPSGRRLAVFASGGMSYNLLPLGEDGALGAVTASLKPLNYRSPASSQTLGLAFKDERTVFTSVGSPHRSVALEITGGDAFRVHPDQTILAGYVFPNIDRRQRHSTSLSVAQPVAVVMA